MRTLMGRLAIRLTRLPDLDTEQDAASRGFLCYGRFAVIRGGSFWFGPAASSHPTTTRIGWYWAVDASGDLLVSARGAGSDGEALFVEWKSALALLVDQLVKRRCIRKPITIVAMALR